MSDEAPTVAADPFTLAPLDEETELRALVRALEFSEGFKLIFARCNQIPQRQRLMEEVRGRLAGRNVQVISLTKPVTHLLDELRPQVQQPAPDAIFITGLEYSLPVAAEAHNTEFVANLNASRNSFPRVFPCPLVLWLPEYILTAVTLAAPDFFSIRSGIYFFAIASEDARTIADSLVLGPEWTLESLTVSEKQERAAAIEGLLSDYEALPPSQRDYLTELRLNYRLAILFASLGLNSSAQQHIEKILILAKSQGYRDWMIHAFGSLGILSERQNNFDEAERMYQQTLLITQELGDKHNEGAMLNNLGNLYRKLGRLPEAESFLRRSLHVFRELGRRVSEGRVLGNLGLIYSRQGRFAEAHECFQQALAISRELNNRSSEMRTIIALGRLYEWQDDLAGAEEAYRQGLFISRDIGDYHYEASALHGLALIRDQQGRLEEAEKLYDECLAVSRKSGYRPLEGESLRMLAKFRALEGDSVGALKLLRQAVEIFEEIRDPRLEAARQQLADLERAPEQK